MLEAARGWLTPGVLFVLVNLVVATIAIASRLMPQALDDVVDERRRGLLRAPSLAISRLRSTFLVADNNPLFDDTVGVQEPSPHTPSVTWTGSSEAEEHGGNEAVAEAAHDNKRRSKTRRATTEEEPALAHVIGRCGEEPAVEVDARADDFIRRFREQLRVQRLDSILRYRDTLRRTGTA